MWSIWIIKNISTQLNALSCIEDKDTLPYQKKENQYRNFHTGYIKRDGKFTEEPIDDLESCNEFVAALKSCTPFQGIYDIKKEEHKADVSQND